MSADTQAALHQAITAHFTDEGWTYDALRGIHLTVLADGLTQTGDEHSYWGSRLLYHNADGERAHLALAAPESARGSMEVPVVRSYPIDHS